MKNDFVEPPRDIEMSKFRYNDKMGGNYALCIMNYALVSGLVFLLREGRR